MKHERETKYMRKIKRKARVCLLIALLMMGAISIPVSASPYLDYELRYIAGAGGSISGEVSQTIASENNGTAVTAVADDGYHFVKWSDYSEGTPRIDNPRTDLNVMGDISVTAIFESNVVTLIADKEEVSEGEGVIFTTNAPDDNMAAFFLDGVFWGNGTIRSTPNPFPWSLIGTGSDSDVVATYRIYDFDSLEDGTITWELAFLKEVNVLFIRDLSVSPILHTLTYIAGENGSLTGITSQIVSDGTSGSIIMAIPDVGYYFNGWSDGVSTVERTDINITGDIIVTANFAVATYSVDFEVNGGNTIDSQMIGYGQVTTVPTNPTRSGYVFQDWYEDGGLMIPWNFETHLITEDTTIYAKWSKKASNSSSSKSDRNKDKGNTNDGTDITGESVMVVINGEEEKAGTEIKSEENGQIMVKVIVNSEAIESKIEEVIENQEDATKNNIEVAIINKTSDVARVLLTGDIIKKLADNDFTLTVSKNDIQYNIPAKEMTIEAVAEQLDIYQSSLKDIEIEVQISKVNDEIMRVYEAMVAQNTDKLIVQPVEFNIVAKIRKIDGTEKSVSINHFNSYVERVMVIPKDVDPSTITTGIVFNVDGTYSHVPTEVFEKEGTWYAKLKSLTNSTYSVIWNPLTVSSVENHWSREIVNNMASRLVITNVEVFNPEDSITRGEFVAYITNALGIYRIGVAKGELFKDVNQTNTLADAITIATEYDIINGYTDGTFRAEATITRQEAMVICARAMDVVELSSIDEYRVNNYLDKDQVADWATESVKKVLASSVFNGISETTISPLATLKYAEAATAINNLLIESGLINK